MKPPKYLAIDPGKTTGYAYFDAEGISTATGQATVDEIITQLYHISMAPKEVLSELVVIVEDFLLLPHMATRVAANRNSRGMEASQVIGATKFFCRLNGSRLIMQRPEKNTLAKVWTGLDSNVNHSKSNWKSAFNHGMYYLVTNRILTVEQAMQSGK